MPNAGIHFGISSRLLLGRAMLHLHNPCINQYIGAVLERQKSLKFGTYMYTELVKTTRVH